MQSFTIYNYMSIFNGWNTRRNIRIYKFLYIKLLVEKHISKRKFK